MTTYSNFLVGGTTGHPSRLGTVKVPYMVDAVIDFSKQNAVTGDVYKVLNIPAGTHVLDAGAELLVAQTGATTSMTCSVGDSGVAGRWVLTQSVFGAAGHLTPVGD